MSAINLVPADRLEDSASQRRIRAWTMRIVVLLSIGVVALAAGMQAVSHRMRAAAELETEFVQLRDRILLAERVLDVRDQLFERQRSITAVQVRNPIVNTLEAFGRALPSGAALTHLQLLHREPNESDAPGSLPSVVLQGIARDHAEVGTLLRELETTGRCDDVQLVRMTERTDGARTVVKFEISARLISEEAG
jgi:Tfp pilus assembly protein PilN